MRYQNCSIQERFLKASCRHGYLRGRGNTKMQHGRRKLFALFGYESCELQFLTEASV